jgi:Tautomerase enzyme
MNWSKSMPDILAEIRGSWLNGKQTEFLKAVHNAVVESLQTPGDEPLARLLVHSKGSYLIPKAAGERFTRIEIALFKGRTLEAKRQLYQTIVRNLCPFGIPSEDVKVVLVEITSEDVGFRGGQAACDIDLGYSTKV